MKNCARGMAYASMTALYLVLHAGHATAQETVAAPSPDEAEKKLDVVYITSTKREESAQDISISINIVDGKELGKNNISDLKELSAQIPGVTFFQTPTIPALSMRGFASPAANPAFDQTVALYTDGIFAGRARQFQAPFFDIDRIEVLRGPQGALLGKNTSAGAISLVSANPTDSFEAEWRGTYLFDREGIDTFGYVSGPIADGLKGRIAVKYLKTEQGWLDNVATGEGDPRSDIIQGRITLEWDPAEWANIVTKLEASDFDERGRPMANFSGTQPLEDVIAYRRDVPGVFGVEDGTTIQNLQFSNTATFDVGDFSLVSVTGYAEFSSDSVGGGGANNPEVFGTSMFEEFDQLSQEIRLVSPSGKTFEWIAGVYYDQSTYEAVNIPRYNVLGVFNGQGRTLFGQESVAYSAYATGTVNFTDKFRTIAGLRWTQIKKDGDFSLTQDFGLPFGYVPGTVLSDTIKDSHVDPAIALEFDLLDELMLYASWSQGSKGGAFQGANRLVTAPTFALEPEESENIEVGFKSAWADWLVLNVSAFQLTFTNLQTGQYVGSPPTLINVNAGEAQSKGVEWTSSALLGKNFSVDFVGTYLDAKYTDYPGAPCTVTQLANGCVNGSINAAGRRLGGQPLWSGSLGISYENTFPSGMTLSIEPRIAYRSRANIDAGQRNSNYGFQDSHAKVDLRVALEGESGNWELALIGKNIFDTITSNAAFGWGFPFSPTPTTTVQVDPGRSMGIQLTLRQ